MTKHCCKRGEPRVFLERLVGHQGDECIKWPYKTGTSGYGYAYIGKRYYSASRLMCILAHGEPYLIWNEAAHSCGNRWCVNPNHLSWKNKRGNAADRLAHGTHHRGANSPVAKLTEEQARAIIESKEPTRILAERYGMEARNIRRIQTGKRWGHLQRTEPQQQEAA
jgi:hypothetical protein